MQYTPKKTGIRFGDWLFEAKQQIVGVMSTEQRAISFDTVGYIGRSKPARSDKPEAVGLRSAFVNTGVFRLRKGAPGERLFGLLRKERKIVSAGKCIEKKKCQ